MSSTRIRKLGLHHFAMLRAVAEGLDPVVSSQRYLVLDGDTGRVAAKRAFEATMDHVRGLARRNGDPRWRLIGLQLRAAADGGARPNLARWAEENGLEDFSEAEQLVLYAEAFPTGRKDVRNARLRSRQLDALRDYETTAAEPARPSDRIDAWIPEPFAGRLLAAGMLTLQDLVQRIQAGGRWWRGIPAIGETKAHRIAMQLEVLLPGACATLRSPEVTVQGQALVGALRAPSLDLRAKPALPTLSAPSAPGELVVLDADGPALTDGQRPQVAIAFALTPRQLAARDLDADADAVKAWIRARAKSQGTVNVYRRELGRFLLFLQTRERTLNTCLLDDCLAYTALLGHVPPSWTNPAKSPLGNNQWAPFAGQLSAGSQRQALMIISSCVSWLASARYVHSNVWLLVNKKVGDDMPSEIVSRALEPRAWSAITEHLEAEAALGDASAERMVFVLQFLEATGLRAAELLSVRLHQIIEIDGQPTLRVVGKGSKARSIPLAPQAVRAMDRYLRSRGLDPEAPPADAFLLAPLDEDKQDGRLGYRSLHKSMKSWIERALTASTQLTIAEKQRASKASPHWLRHTCGTRLTERDVPIDVVAQVLGHSDLKTAAKYARAQQKRTAAELARAFG